MIILSAVLLGLIIGLIRRGSFCGFSDIAKWPLGLIGVLILVFLHYYCYFGGESALSSYFSIISFAGYILILVTLIFNLDDVFAIMLAVGLTANFIVIFVNGGLMPVQESIISLMPASSPVTVSISTGISPVYTIMQQPGTLLWFLGDVLPLSFLANITTYFGSVPGISAGTIFVAVGLIGWVQGLMAGSAAKAQAPQNGRSRKSAKQKPVFTQDSKPVRPQHFESRTEELFFEDELLPDDPLDSFFNDEPLGSDKTEVIPTLDTQNISGIRGRLGSAALGTKDMDDYDPSSETKIINGLEDLPDYLAPDTEIEPALDSEEVLPQGFFTQSFNAQKGAGQRAFATGEILQDEPLDADEADTGNYTAVRSDIPQTHNDNNSPAEEVELTDSVVFDEPKESFEDADDYFIPNDTPRKRYDVEEGSSYIVSQAYKEEMARKDRTEEEMLNIWAQVSEDQIRLKSSRRRQSRYASTETNPYLEEKKRREAAEMARQEAEEQERIRDEERRLADQRYQAQRSEEAANSSRPVEDTAEDVIMTDEDRVAAGYEKVSFQISGRDVSFWKKKKD